MNCSEVMKRLSELADGELGWWESVWVRVHAARCPNCAKQLRAMRALGAKATSALKDPVEYTDLCVRIMASLPERQMPARRHQAARWVTGLAYGAVGICIGVGAVLWLLPAEKSPGKQVAQHRQVISDVARVKPQEPRLGPELKYRPIARRPQPELQQRRQVAVAGKQEKNEPEVETTRSTVPVTALEVTVCARPMSTEGSSETTSTVMVMGRPVRFGAGSSRVVEKPLAEDDESRDVEREPLESVVRLDPLAERILAKS